MYNYNMAQKCFQVVVADEFKNQAQNQAQKQSLWAGWPKSNMSKVGAYISHISRRFSLKVRRCNALTNCSRNI